MSIGWFDRLAGDVRGNTAVIFAICLFPLYLLVSSGVDLQIIANQKSKLQTVADNAALSAVQQMAVLAREPDRIEQAARAFVQSSMDTSDLSMSVDVDMESRTISINLAAPPQGTMGGPFSRTDKVGVSASARLAGEAGNVCLIGLSTRAKRSLRMNEKARLTARGCSIYTNSNHAESIYINDLAKIRADYIYTAGGIQGSGTRTKGIILTDAPPIGDPLESRPPPKASGCDNEWMVIKRYKVLSPGVYCGTLVVDGGTVKFKPGVYILKFGIEVKNGGRISGENVGFYLAGKWSKLQFHKESHISLTAPKTGPMAGLLFYSAKSNRSLSSATRGKELIKGHFIRSDDARRLVGTIYLPDDKLIIDGDEKVADKSEYTVIVARAFELNNGPNLVLRTDYHLSDIPVPEGVGPVNNFEAQLVN